MNIFKNIDPERTWETKYAAADGTVMVEVNTENIPLRSHYKIEGAEYVITAAISTTFIDWAQGFPRDTVVAQALRVATNKVYGEILDALDVLDLHLMNKDYEKCFIVIKQIRKGILIS